VPLAEIVSHRLILALPSAKVLDVDVVDLPKALMAANDVNAAVLNLAEGSARGVRKEAGREMAVL
jgi:hypothetical protein